MYIAFEIKTTLFKKITVEEIIDLSKLSYGIMSDTFTLNINEIGNYTILLDIDNIGRGFELRVDKSSIFLTMGYPSTKHEIKLMYDLIVKICNKLKINKFYRDKEKFIISKIEDYIENDIHLSEELLKKVEQKVLLGINKNELVLGGVNPVFLGKKEFQFIDSSIDNFEKLLNDYQNTNAIICEPKFYKRSNETIYSVFDIYEKQRTIVRKNYSMYFISNDIKEHYVCLGGLNYIKYEDFISNIKEYKYYDDESIEVILSSDDIYDLIKDRCIDLNTNLSTKEIYFGKFIDNAYYHQRKIYKNNFDLDPSVACNHIAVFFRYFYKKNLLNEEFLSYISDIDKVIDDKIELRNYILNNMYIQGRIRLGYFKKDVQDFIESYYSFVLESNCYPIAVDEVAMEYFGLEKYNCDEFKTEGYLFVPYDDEYYLKLSNHIEKHYNEYLTRKSRDNKNE